MEFSKVIQQLVLAAAQIVLAAGLAVAQEEVRLRPVAAIYIDAKGTAIDQPEGIAYDGESLLVAADTGNQRLVLYQVAGGETLPTSEIRLGQIPYPVHVRVDSQGEILVLDGKSHRIARVSARGQFKGYLEIPAGDAPLTIKSFEIDGRDNLYVLDVSGARVLVIDSEGSTQRTIGFPEDVGLLSGLTVNPAGVVFAVDSVQKRVFVARANDQALVPLTEPMPDEMVFPTGIAADSGHLFIADQYDGAIVVLAQDGSFRGRPSRMGWKQGFLRYPTGLSAANGYLFVADRGNNRIQGFAILQ